MSVEFPLRAIKRLALVTLGKMIQSAPGGSSDILAPYLRAAHVQPDGNLIELEEQPMWFSPLELASLSLRRGDVVVVEGGAGFGRSALIARDRPGWGFQNSIVRVRPFPNQSIGGFVNYALQAALWSGQIAVATNTATIPHFTAEKVGAFEIPAPSPEVQQAVERYLDRETAEIDAFIADQEELIALLTERRAATITHAVTKGLDSTSPMARDEDWYTWRPESWQVQKLAWLFTTIGSGTTPPHDSNDYYNGEIPWVTTGELREKRIVETSAGISARAVAELSALRIYPSGSLVIAMYGATIGRLGFLGVPATTNQACCVFAEPKNVNTRYVFYVLQAAKPHLLVLADGGGQPNINQEKLRELRVPVPPLEQQQEIADYLDHETAEIDAAIADAREAIALSRERRAALISAAVTGKIDVWSAA